MESLSKWVSVKTKLPSDLKDHQDGDFYLVSIKEEIRPKVGIYWDEWIVSAYGENTPDEEFHNNDEITHWLKIPKTEAELKNIKRHEESKRKVKDGK